MTRYLASRFAGMVIVMLLVATLVFFITRLAPGDPAAVMLGDQATAADIATLRTARLKRPPDRATDLAGGARAARELGLNRLAERLENAGSVADL